MKELKNSELRQDLVSGDWILFAPGRMQYSWNSRKNTKKRVIAPLRSCPFEMPQKFVSEQILFEYVPGHMDERTPKKLEDWKIMVLQNKYPAVTHKDIRVKQKLEGPFSKLQGSGHHDLVITRDHKKDFPDLAPELAFHVLDVFRMRYLMLFLDPNIAYISIFHNWGPQAGATVFHPHYQMIGIPVVPPDICRSLEGSARYFQIKKKCIHCAMLEWERKEKTRVILETEHAIAIAPFVSRRPFEVRVFPKAHSSYFENASDVELKGVAVALQSALQKMKKNLGDPDYNFFIHTAPILEKKKYDHYHWHIEVLPKISTRAGFEYGTGMEINVIDPDFAARALRKNRE